MRTGTQYSSARIFHDGGEFVLLLEYMPCCPLHMLQHEVSQEKKGVSRIEEDGLATG